MLNWDTHSNNFGTLKNQLLPPMDQGVAALLDDLEATGLLDDTLVLPAWRVRPDAEDQRQRRGREHWP